MSYHMKDEAIAMVAVDKTTRHLGECRRLEAQGKVVAPKTNGELAEEALQEVEAACREGRLGFLHRSFTQDPDDLRVYER